jgi:heme-degrading monooxygenase HmoA
MEVWADDATFMKQQAGFISTQLHRGTAGSCTFINIAIWESAIALGQAFRSPEFQQRTAAYPDGAVAAPHVFEKVAVRGICVQ